MSQSGVPSTHEPGEQGTRQYMTVTLDQRHYGIPLNQVAEISPNRDLRRMPHMPAAIEGLLDLRGKVIPVMNLRHRLGLSELERDQFGNILILDTGAGQLGVLVDKVESVVTAGLDEHASASGLLAGRDGFWITGFLVQNNRVTLLLDVNLLQKEREYSGSRSAHDRDLEHRLDESLRRLIELAPDKSETGSGTILPEMQAAIANSELEMSHVLERIEAMMVQAAGGFQGLAQLKGEYAKGTLQGQEKVIAELEKNNQRIQDCVADLMTKLQFQDLARQKLERVLRHLKSLEAVVGEKLGENLEDANLK